MSTAAGEIELPETFAHPVVDNWYQTKDVYKTLQLANIACLGGRKGSVIGLARRNLIEIFESLRKTLMTLEMSIDDYNKSSYLNYFGASYDPKAFDDAKSQFNVLQHRLQFVTSIF